MTLFIFFTSLASFCFELVCLQVVSYVRGSAFAYSVMGLAILGQCAAGSLVSIFEWRAPKGWAAIKRSHSTLYWLAILLAVSFVAILVLTAAVERAHFGMESGLLKALARLTMAVPFFIFGVLINLVFVKVSKEKYAETYFLNLAGGAVGCVLWFFLIEKTTFYWTVVVPVFLCLLSGLIYKRGESQRKLSSVSLSSVVLIPFIVFFAFFPGSFEPKADLDFISRNYFRKHPVKEIWKGWNSYSHVSVVEATLNDVPRKLAILGNSEGRALFTPYDPDMKADSRDFVTSLLSLSLKIPKDVLVLLAGAGSDMVYLNAYSGGQSHITGVEMNSRVIESAFQFPALRLKEFFERENIFMKVEEARVSLERDQKKYDVILVSWSGATCAYYQGAIVQTTQYLYTHEGLISMMKRLKPGGMIVIMEANKLRLLSVLRSVMRERGVAHPENTAVILSTPGPPGWDWKYFSDNNRLLIKPSGFNDEELQRIDKLTREFYFELIYTPAMVMDTKLPGRAYWEVMHTKDPEDLIKKIGKETGLNLTVTRDDKPFIFDVFPAKGYLSRPFWKKVFLNFNKEKDSYKENYLFFVVVVFLVSLAFLFTPIFLLPKAEYKKGWVVGGLSYFFAIGAGFMFVEIGFIQKFSLLLGAPGFTIMLILAALVFFSGIGSWCSAWTFKQGLEFKQVIIALIAWLLFFVFSVKKITPHLMPFSLLIRSVAAVFMIAPAGILMGHLFPQGLVLIKEKGNALVPWAWAVNGASSAIASAMAPLLAQIMGFQWVIFIGVVCYAIILFLPHFSQKPALK